MSQGTPVKCKNCGREMTVRLTRGTKISNIPCYGCGTYGYKRNTEYDKASLANGEKK